MSTKAPQHFPDAIHVEVKLTSATRVQLEARELQALQARTEGAEGIIAVLFVDDDRKWAGRWIVADASESFGRLSSSGSITVGRDRLHRIMTGQTWLDPVRQHIDRRWKPFLNTFRDEAFAGRRVLHEELKRCHERFFTGCVVSDDVTQVEHLDTMRRIIDQHGDTVAGQIFQQLFAYLLSEIGYRRVVINSVGVPDIAVSELAFSMTANDKVDIGFLDIQDLEQIAQCCREAGELKIAQKIECHISRTRRPR